MSSGTSTLYLLVADFLLFTRLLLGIIVMLIDDWISLLYGRF